MAKEIPFDTIEFLHLLMEAVPHMLFVVDAEMRVFHVNSAASRKLHVDRQKVYMHRGGEVLRCLHATDDEDGCGHGTACHDCVVRASVSKALTNNLVLQESTALELITPLGSSKVHFQVTASPFTYEGNRFALLVMEDTTELKMATEELQRLNGLLIHQAMTDPLTGIANRLKFSEALHTEIHRSRRYGVPLSLIMVTNNTRDSAVIFAEKLRHMINDYDFPCVKRVTCSFGVAQLTADENEEQLAERVDSALYRAKGAGRNRVETS